MFLKILLSLLVFVLVSSLSLSTSARLLSRHRITKLFSTATESLSSSSTSTSSSSSSSSSSTSSSSTTTTSSSSSSSNKELNVLERVSRAINFYKAAIPVFLSYQLLDTRLQFQREQLNENITKEEEEKQFDKLHEWGSEIITEKIKELKGFYVKTGQIISTRVDIFPQQYTSKLAIMQDALDPLDGEEIKQIVRDELLDGGDLSELFSEFDIEPLGSASIAQVHKAKLLDGRVVAVKVQRPGIEGKLLGDIANLKNFAKIIADFLPLDYYKVFCELERTLIYELDFLHEAQATIKVAAAVAHTPSNRPRSPPVTVPLPIPGLVSRRVMVLEFIEGTALSKIASKMQSSNVKPGSPESILFGKFLLSALTEAYGAMIFGSGIIHGGNYPYYHYYFNYHYYHCY